MSSVASSLSRSERIAALVLEVQARRDDRAGSALLRLVSPELKRAARCFGASARGSLEFDDLEQVGAVAALKLVDKFKPGAYPFEVLVYLRARKACAEYVRAHANPVRRTKAQTRDGMPLPGFDSDDRAEMPDPRPSPELQVISAETRQRLLNAVGQVEQRDLVREVFGIGRDTATSMREVARRRGLSAIKVAHEVRTAVRVLGRGVR